MRLEFEDDDLRRLYQESDFRAPGWGPELLRSYRKVLGFVEAASDERDLRAMKSRHLEKLKGSRRGQYSLQLHQQWRLVFRIGAFHDEQQVVVIEVVDYH